MKPRIRLSQIWKRSPMGSRCAGSLAWKNKWVCHLPGEYKQFRNGFGTCPEAAFEDWQCKYGKQP